MHRFSRRYAGYVVAVVTRRSDDISNLPVCIYGPDCWLLFGASVQNHERTRLETGRLFDGHFISGDHLWHLFLFEFLHLG